MKKSSEIQGLPIFSLIDGEEIGKVKQLVIKPDNGHVQLFLVENDQDAIGIHVLPYAASVGVGDFAVTVEAKDAIQEITQVAGARDLVLLGYKIIGTRVLSRKGQLLGHVDEYFVEEETGSVTACSFIEPGTVDAVKMFDRANIMTFGRDVIVIKQEELIFQPGESVPVESAPVVVEAAAAAEPAPAEAPAPVAPIAALEESVAATPSPNAYLIGKVLSSDLNADSGELFAAKGTLITDELITRAKLFGPTLFMKLNRLASEQE